MYGCNNLNMDANFEFRSTITKWQGWALPPYTLLCFVGPGDGLIETPSSATPSSAKINIYIYSQTTVCNFGHAALLVRMLVYFKWYKNCGISDKILLLLQRNDTLGWIWWIKNVQFNVTLQKRLETDVKFCPECLGGGLKNASHHWDSTFKSLHGLRWADQRKYTCHHTWSIPYLYLYSCCGGLQHVDDL